MRYEAGGRIISGNPSPLLPSQDSSQTEWERNWSRADARRILVWETACARSQPQEGAAVGKRATPHQDLFHTARVVFPMGCVGGRLSLFTRSVLGSQSQVLSDGIPHTTRQEGFSCIFRACMRPGTSDSREGSTRASWPGTGRTHRTRHPMQRCRGV